MAGRVFAQGEGAAFVLEKCGRRASYLGCHDFGDITPPAGTNLVIRCKSPIRPNETVVERTIFQPSTDPITLSITTDFGSAEDILERLQREGCDFTLIIQYSCGVPSDFTDFERMVVVNGSNITAQPTLTAPTVRDPSAGNDRVSMTFNIEAASLEFVSVIEALPFTTDQGENITALNFSNLQSCSGSDDCGEDRAICDRGYAAALAVGGAVTNPGQVLVFQDGWDTTAVDPGFATDGSIGELLTISLGSNRERLIAFRGGDGVAGNFEIMISDDTGATWSSVFTGAVGETVAQLGRGIWRDPDTGRIYLLTQTTTNGSVYYSDDAGVTWNLLQDGLSNVTRSIAGQDNMIFIVGTSNTIRRSYDCMQTSTVVAGPAANAGGDIWNVTISDDDRVWLSTDNGVFVSENDGVTWEQSTGLVSLLTYDVQFAPGNPCCGYAIGTGSLGAGDAEIYRTNDGGHTWARISDEITFTDGEFEVLHVCNCNLAYVGGQNGSLTTITTQDGINC